MMLPLVIPYVVFTSFMVGPFTVQVWGMFVALGILAGTLLMMWRARSRHVDPSHIMNMAVWVVVGGLLGARIVFLLEYGREIGWHLGLLEVQDGGLSATGGVIGGVLAALWYVLRHRLSFPLLTDLAAPGLLFGEGIGRLGCFFIHDHLGRPTTFPLSVNVFGIQRHEVGLELAVMGVIGGIVLLLCERWSARWLQKGMLGVFALLWYALTRLGLDTLRATDLPIVDRRYGWLTFAQYGAILALTIGSVLLYRLRSRTQRS